MVMQPFEVQQHVMNQGMGMGSQLQPSMYGQPLPGGQQQMPIYAQPGQPMY